MKCLVKIPGNPCLGRIAARIALAIKARVAKPVRIPQVLEATRQFQVPVRRLNSRLILSMLSVFAFNRE